jgi:hypothetical protein
MANDTDGINDALDSATRVALTLASQVGARLARERERAARDARSLADADAREVYARLAAERAAARAQLAPIERDAWWEVATRKEVAEALQVAVTWQADDARAAAAVEIIHRHVRERYGVSTDQWLRQPDQSSVSATVTERRTADSAERSEVIRTPADGDSGERTASRRDGHDFDSPGRRRQRADRLRERGHEAETVAAVLSADVSQARPATDAAVPAPVSASRLAASPRRQQVELRP